MALLNFPNEILNSVVDYVAIDPKGPFVGPDLLNLVLTHLHFFKLAAEYFQKHSHYLQYRSVVIGHTESESKRVQSRQFDSASELLQIVHRDPDVVSYIRSVCYQACLEMIPEAIPEEDGLAVFEVAEDLLSNCGFLDHIFKYNEGDLETAKLDWAFDVAEQAEEAALTVLLALLPNIEIFRLRNRDDSGDHHIPMLDNCRLLRANSSVDLRDAGRKFKPLQKLRILELDGIDCAADALSVFHTPWEMSKPPIKELHLRDYSCLRATGHDRRTWRTIKTVVLHDCHCHHTDILTTIIEMFPNLRRLVCCCTGKLKGRLKRIGKRIDEDRSLQETLRSNDLLMTLTSDSRGSGFSFTKYVAPFPLDDRPEWGPWVNPWLKNDRV